MFTFIRLVLIVIRFVRNHMYMNHFKTVIVQENIQSINN